MLVRGSDRLRERGSMQTEEEKRAAIEAMKKSPIVRFGGGFVLMCVLFGTLGAAYGTWKHFARAAETETKESESAIPAERQRELQRHVAARSTAMSCLDPDVHNAATAVLRGMKGPGYRLRNDRTDSAVSNDRARCVAMATPASSTEGPEVIYYVQRLANRAGYEVEFDSANQY